MIRRSCVMVIVLLAICFPLAACRPEPEALPVVRYVNFRVYDPVYVGIEQGFYQKRGIDVQIIGDTLAGPTAIQAVSAGAADAGLSSIPAIINANAAGLPILATTDIQSALPGQPLEYYYVLADSDIQSLNDLPGSTFAVNLWRSSFHYTALMALEQQGINDDSLDWVLLPFDRQADALMRGAVDVIGLMEPHNSYALGLYGDRMRLLFDAEDIFGQKQFSTHFVNRLWAEYNPEQAEAFVNGTVDAILWIHENQDKAPSIIAKYTEIDEQYIPEYFFQPNGQVHMEDFAWWLEYLVGREDVKADWLEISKMATNDYNERVK